MSTKTVRTKSAVRAEPATPIAGGGCRIDDFMKFLAREWMGHILWKLGREETMRFGALRRSLPGSISARVLSKRLKELESSGLVSRHDAGKLPLHVEYRLTEEGRRLDSALRRGETLTARLKKRTAVKSSQSRSAQR